MKKIWECKIGEVDAEVLGGGADSPMRWAIRTAYKSLTGKEPDFIFSGWGGELTEGERAAHEDRLPDEDKTPLEAPEAKALIAVVQGDAFDTDAIDRALRKLANITGEEL